MKRQSFIGMVIALAMATCGWAATALMQERLTPAPGLSLAELKYRLIDAFGGMKPPGEYGGILYCDPDIWPVGIGDLQELAIMRFPTIQQNAEEFTTILQHLHLERIAAFSPEQKQRIYEEHKKLAFIVLESVAASNYQFQLRIAERDGSGLFLVEGRMSEHGSITISKKEPRAVPLCPLIA